MFTRIAGDAGEFPLEHRLLNAACAIGAAACFVITPINVAQHAEPVDTYGVLAVGVLLTTLYFASRLRRAFVGVLVVGNLGNVALGAALWLVDGGSRGAGPWVFLVATLLTIAVARGAVRVTFGVALPLACAALFAVERFVPGAVRDPHHGELRTLDIAGTFGISLAVLGALVLTMSRSHRDVLQRLREEQARSESLLDNMLPSSVSARLKQRASTVADAFEHVTVLFADIVGFTGRAATMSPTELVALLEEVFSLFDALVEKHGLEKIKTIGDAYMAVAGVPEPRADHAQAALEMALDMLDVVRASERLRDLQLRVGLHSGPVVAGVIGRKRFAYDLWGDTVNTASRMESHGAPDAVQVSATTRALLGDRYAVVERTVAIKGKGEMTTYLVGRRAAAGR